ncbi:MAG: ABC transporter permease [Pirellulaceae bacterium]
MSPSHGQIGRSTIMQVVGSGLPPLLAFAGVLLLWQAGVWLTGVHPITLPSPLRVMDAMWEEREALIKGVVATGAASVMGLSLSVVVGLGISILFSLSRWVRSAFYPYVVFLQTVPIVAIAPLLITWFGYGFKTIVLVASIISLFPIVSNVTAGLMSIDNNLRDLFRLAGATRFQELWKLRLPHAMSHLVLGMRVSAGLAVIGAIVGEFFVGTNAAGFEALTDVVEYFTGRRVGAFSGLGTVMTGWQNRARTDAIIAAVFVSTLLGLILLSMVNLLGRTAFRRWTASGSFENEKFVAGLIGKSRK